MDDRRDMWIIIYGIPTHDWHLDIFVALAELWGRFICIDENTAKGVAFNVARMMVNVPISFKLPDTILSNIGGSNFNLFLSKYGIRKILVNSGKLGSATSSYASSDSDSGWSEDGLAEEVMADSVYSEYSIVQFSSKDVLKENSVAIELLQLGGASKGGVVSDSISFLKAGEDLEKSLVGNGMFENSLSLLWGSTDKGLDGILKVVFAAGGVEPDQPRRRSQQHLQETIGFDFACGMSQVASSATAKKYGRDEQGYTLATTCAFSGEQMRGLYRRAPICNCLF